MTPDETPLDPGVVADTAALAANSAERAVALLTMEVRSQRIMLQRMAIILETASRMMQSPDLNLDDA
jgi:hypothetical protein